MSKFLSVIFTVMIVLALVGTSFAGDFCFWKNCPQPNDTRAYSLEGDVKIPTFQLLPNINLNGETDYIFWRKDEDGGPGFGFGAGTTLAVIKSVVDVDAKYVKMSDTDNSDLFGLGAALDVVGVIKAINGTTPLPETVAIKAGVQGLLDTTHDFHPCGGVYTKIVWVLDI